MTISYGHQNMTIKLLYKGEEDMEIHSEAISLADNISLNVF